MTFDAHVLTTLQAEMRRLKALGDTVLDQVEDESLLNRLLDPESNSIAIIVKHLSGNMRSRWTDLLTSDGEKPDRDRDGEFDQETRWNVEQTRRVWEAGWETTRAALDALSPADLQRTITIRGESLTVTEAIVRQVAHYAQHVGQMLLLAKHLLGSAWKTPSIPRGQSRAQQWSYRQYGRS